MDLTAPLRAADSAGPAARLQKLFDADLAAVIDAQGLSQSAFITRLAEGPKFGLDRASARERLSARVLDHPLATPERRLAGAIEMSNAALLMIEGQEIDLSQPPGGDEQATMLKCYERKSGALYATAAGGGPTFCGAAAADRRAGAARRGAGDVTARRAQLATGGYAGPLLVMQGYGGLLPADEAANRAVGMIESGPAAGVIGSQFLGDLMGDKDVIAADMGGTTFKVGVIQDGELEFAREPMVDRYHYVAPKIEVVSIGAGGGSIGSLEPRTTVPRGGPRFGVRCRLRYAGLCGLRPYLMELRRTRKPRSSLRRPGEYLRRDAERQ
mgnify:CR=1 FL=1